MTQPIQEPSVERSISGVDYRTRQLARRPRPVAPTGLAFPWIRIGQYSRTIADSTVLPLASRQLWYDPALVTEDVDFSWDQESVGELHDSWVVRSRKEGFYLWDALINVGVGGSLPNDSGTLDLWLSDDVTDDDLGEYMESWDIFDTGTFTSGDQGEGHQFLHAAGLVYVVNTNRSWHWKMVQTTGGSLEIGVEYITIMRIMESVSADWTNLTTT